MELDCAIARIGVLYCVVRFKCIKKFVQNIILTSLAHHHFRVLLSIVVNLDVRNVDLAIAGSVHLFESLHTQVASELVHLTHNCSQELVV